MYVKLNKYVMHVDIMKSRSLYTYFFLPFLDRICVCGCVIIITIGSRSDSPYTQATIITPQEFVGKVTRVACAGALERNPIIKREKYRKCECASDLDILKR
jgi:hypothetical protein